MNTTRVGITLNRSTLERLDSLVGDHNIFPNRSRAIQEAVQEKLERMEHSRLARECAKLDPASEKAMAEEGLFEESNKWPGY
jgi:metal-responsive CopG/Arc/MetJ family transcriptional regulator